MRHFVIIHRLGTSPDRVRPRKDTRSTIAPSDILPSTGDVEARASADLGAVVNFYDDRFHIGFSRRDKADFVAFLRSL